ncbi:hypothetical protein [Sporosalibacterium faouarense]|nr:hypothetical protein [Sporosalibacterium faouarense]
MNRKASKGIDKISAKEFEANLTKEVNILERNLKISHITQI